MAAARHAKVKVKVSVLHVCQSLQLLTDSEEDVPFTVRVDSLPNRIWKEIKQQPSMLPGPAVPGCC